MTELAAEAQVEDWHICNAATGFSYVTPASGSVNVTPPREDQAIRRTT